MMPNRHTRSFSNSPITTVFFLSSISLITACGGGSDGDSSGQVGTDVVSRNSTAAKAIPLSNPVNCPSGRGFELEYGIDSNGNGILDSDEVNGAEEICYGTNGVNGVDGVTSMIETDEDNGAQCSNGGISIRIGLDFDNSASLESSETLETRFICDGVDGIDGVNGTDGTNGLQSLVGFSTPGENLQCPARASQIESGLDLNSNGVLDAEEVTNVRIVCDGVDGRDALNSLIAIQDYPVNATCPRGGVLIDYGVDDNDNDILDLPEESDGSSIVCSFIGPRGEQGEQGTQLLISTEILEAGEICPTGGIRTYIGYDNNENSILDLEERQTGNTADICNGERGESCELVDLINNSSELRCGDEVFVLDPGVEYSDFEVTETDDGIIIEDSWNSIGFPNFEDPRNPHYFISVNSDSELSFVFQAESSIRERLIIRDLNGTERLNTVGSIGSSPLETTITLEAGDYRFALAGSDNSTWLGNEGQFSFEIVGDVGNVRKVDTATVSVSNTQAWTYGKSGPNFASMFSSLNPLYSFDVAVDSHVYIEPRTNTSAEYFQLRDESTGLELDLNSSPGVTRLNAGTYTLGVSQGSFSPQPLELSVVGALENWAEIPVNTQQYPLNLTNMTRSIECAGLDGASFEINVNETGILDIVLEYGNQNMQMCLFSPLGAELETAIHNSNSVTPGKLYLQSELTPGTYTLVLGAREDTSADVIITALGAFDSITLLP